MPKITPEQFKFFSDLVKSSSGIALTKGKEYLLESRLAELTKVLGIKDIDELYRRARFKMSPQLKKDIIEAMTTNETYFFRDQHPFTALQKEIIPELIEKNKNKRSLRIWSAASSTGQEAYSIAILIQEHFPILSNWRVEILGTDISYKAVKKAQDGRYTQVEANRGLPITLLIKYFKQQGAFWIVNDKIKKMVRFKIMNLVGPLTGIGTFDIILCRYVLIYFDMDTKKQILNKLTNALNPGGYLFLGATETPVGLPSNMKRIVIGRAACWKKQG